MIICSNLFSSFQPFLAKDFLNINNQVFNQMLKILCNRKTIKNFLEVYYFLNSSRLSFYFSLQFNQVLIFRSFKFFPMVKHLHRILLTCKTVILDRLFLTADAHSECSKSNSLKCLLKVACLQKGCVDYFRTKDGRTPSLSSKENQYFHNDR